jgi:putative glutamine amidotransferase
MMRHMSRPVIGITVDYNDKLTCYESPYGYSTAVEKAGGLPLLIPYRSDLALIPQFVDLIDGMLFSGGDDLDPKSWGEEYYPGTSPIDPLREKFERALMAEVEKRRTPTLGICLGSQLMNVYRGGSMHQFLPELSRPNAIEHRKTGGDEGRDRAGKVNRHEIFLERESAAAHAIGKTEISANTSHKQSVNRVGRGLRIIGKAPDGVIEGVEDPTMPLWLGVQWHPERLHEEKEHLALFKLLVQKSAGRE